MNSTQSKIWAVVNLLTFIIMVGVNGAANALPINGRMTGEISDMFPSLFTPAGYVFSIWGLIYLLLGGFVIYTLLPAGRENPRAQRIGYWFAASSIFNTVWIFLWHYLQFGLTVLAMLGVLVSLIIVYWRLRIGKEQSTWAEKLFLELPFSVYLGWITVATVANLSVFFLDQGWSGQPLSPQFWTILMIGVAALLGLLMTGLRREVAYTLVLTWAFVGIWVRQAETPSVATTALGVGLALLVIALARPLFSRLTGARTVTAG